MGLGIVFGLVAAAAAHAEGRVAVLDGPPGMTPIVGEEPRVDRLQPVPVVEAVPPLAAIADGDATSDRAFGRSTAIGLQQGQFDFSMRTAVEHGSMISVAAGLTNKVELSADAGYARHVADDYGVGLKLSVLRRATYALAIDVSVHSTSEESVRSSLASVDVKVTTCALGCNMLVTAGLGFTATSSDSVGQTMPTFELSMIFGTGVVRPIIEGLAIYGDSGANFAFGGLRIGGKHVGIDLGAGVLEVSYRDAAVGMMVGLGVRP